MKTAKQLLAETAKFFKLNPDKFIQRGLAQNAKGKPVNVTSPDATCFCSIGHVLRQIIEDDPDETSTVRNNPYYVFHKATGLQSSFIYNYNDDHEVEAVVEFLKGQANAQPA